MNHGNLNQTYSTDMENSNEVTQTFVIWHHVQLNNTAEIRNEIVSVHMEDLIDNWTDNWLGSIIFP